jgi:hypothetical protein
MPTELETAALSGGSACSRLAKARLVKSRQLKVAAKFEKKGFTLDIKGPDIQTPKNRA